MDTHACHACGAPLTGRYCAACGQRRPAPDDFSLRRFFRAAWHEVSDADSRLLRTLRDLPRPGVLTEAFAGYRWQAYLPPLRLYLVLSGLYFLLAWGPYFELGAESVRQAPPGTIPAVLAALYDDPVASDAVSDLTALFKIVFVVVMGFWVALLLRGRRRPVGVHMIFALHYTAFDFAYFALLAPAVAWAPDGSRALVGSAVIYAGMAALGAWAVLGVRRVYGLGAFASAWRGLAILGMDLVLSTLAGQLAVVVVLLQRAAA